MIETEIYNNHDMLQTYKKYKYWSKEQKYKTTTLCCTLKKQKHAYVGENKIEK